MALFFPGVKRGMTDHSPWTGRTMREDAHFAGSEKMSPESVAWPEKIDRAHEWSGGKALGTAF